MEKLAKYQWCKSEKEYYLPKEIPKLVNIPEAKYNSTIFDDVCSITDR